MALKINQSLIRDESKISLEYNQESGLTNFRGFSFYGENEDEREVRRQLIKYTKLRNALNRKMKQIHNEEGTFKESHLRQFELFSPSSSLSSSVVGTTTMMPTPPVLEEGSSRNSIPSQYQKKESRQESALGMPFAQPKQITLKKTQIIDKKSKQQMIMTKLGGEVVSDRGQLYKSFQPESVNSTQKKVELFRSNVENTGCGLLGHNQQALSHNEYLNESIQDLSSNDESVAEERDFEEENAIVPITNTHQIMYNGQEESKEGTQNNTMEESKEEEEIISPGGEEMTNVKFILF